MIPSEAMSSTERMIQIVNGMCVSRCVAVAAELGIAELLAEGAETISDLSRETESDPDSLYRVLRMLSGFGIFLELPDRRFQNTPLSATLRRGAPGSVRDYARLFGCRPHWRFWGDLDYSVRTGKPASTKDHPGSTPFEVMALDPAYQAIFNDAMTALAATEGTAIVQAYDFTPFARIIDVGGGHGTLATLIARAAPQSRVAIYDLPQVVEGAKARIAAESLTDRMVAAGGSFLENVPGPADLCVMRNVVHDWDDASARLILRNCRDALSESGRVLVCEMVIGSGPDATAALVLDIEMLAGAGGRERTEEQYSELFRSAGLRLQRVIPTQSPIQLLEGVPG